MPDELTLGEVARRVDAGFTDIKDDIRDVAKRLDGKVNMERYQLEREAALEAHRLLTERVTAVEASRKAEADQRRERQEAAENRRRADRRLVWSALIAPALMVLLQVFLAARGAGS